ncbi:MAG: T9SS type A sorting domain-containing protein [Sphingobacteriia bacterium]|nr:T9SS type A sorting domain-containing protein [Sphingobacteriia bacterium]
MKTLNLLVVLHLLLTITYSVARTSDKIPESPVESPANDSPQVFLSKSGWAPAEDEKPVRGLLPQVSDIKAYLPAQWHAEFYETNNEKPASKAGDSSCERISNLFLYTDIFKAGFSVPQIAFNPEVVNTYHTMPMITTETLTVSNTGSNILNFNISTILQTESGIAPHLKEDGSGIPMENLYTTGCTYGDGIISWSLSNLNTEDIPCTGNPPWYHYYNEPAQIMETGNLQKLFITTGYDSTYITVWIDYNDNFDLTPDEILLDNAFCTYAGEMNVFFVTIPPTANVGLFVMRARTNRNNPVTGPYETYEYGNCVDFDILVDNGMVIDWLSVSPRNGELYPGDSMQVHVTFDSNFPPSPNGYHAFLKFVSNTPDSPHLVPASITFTPLFPAVNDFSCFFSNLTTVKLSWLPPIMETLRWDSGENCNGIGGTTHFSVAARWSPDFLTAFDGWLLTHLLFYPTSAEATYILKIWTGEQAENLMYSQTVDDYIPDQWNTVMLEQPVSVTSGEWYWMGYEVTDFAWNYPAGADCGPATAGYGDMIQFDGQTWHSLSTSFGHDNNWNIAGILVPGNNEKAGSYLPNQYNVYRNDELIATLPSTTCEYTDSLVPMEIPDYLVGAVYDECESMSDTCSPVPISWLEVVPEYFTLALIQNEVLTEELLIENAGHLASSMDYQIEIRYLSSETGWLALSQISGQVLGSMADTIAVNINTSNLSIGDHLASLVITSNARNIQMIEIPVVLNLLTGIYSSHRSPIRFYPNPTSGVFTISGIESEAWISIINAFGVEIFSGSLHLPADLDLTHHSKGVYFVRMETEMGSIFRKVVVN